MIQLITISGFATAAIIAAYYFGIGLLYKYRKGVSKILAFIVFFSIIGYGMYRDYQDEKIVESALTEITTEIDNAEKSMMSDKDFHEFVAKSVSQKDGVSLNIIPQIDTAILKINKIYQNVLNDPDFKIMITSANDSKSHSKNSAHYRGQAVDIRIKNINHRHKNEIIAAIKEILGDRFLVLHEDKGKPNEHLHVQLKNNGWWKRVDECVTTKEYDEKNRVIHAHEASRDYKRYYSSDDDVYYRYDDEHNAVIKFSNLGTWSYKNYEQTDILPNGYKIVRRWSIPLWTEKVRKFFKVD